MLLAFIIWSIIAVTIANPLHKYPYVFLLDVGNEELDKTNTEQLRVSIPGGSLAIKYPAMGEGDPISHVRVSGIDFGTDLKVNIVGGGPGYKYVVLMFMGNPGINYDAVVTLQTLQTLPSDTETSIDNTNAVVATKNLVSNSYEVSDADSDDNDQDQVNSSSDSKNMQQYNKKSNEVMQSTSTFYNYAKSEIADGDEDNESKNVSSEEHDDNDDDDDDSEEEEENGFSNNDQYNFSNKAVHEFSNQEEREVSNGDEDENYQDEIDKARLYSGQNFNRFSDIPRAEQYRYNVDVNNADDDKPADIVDDSLYDKYQDLNPHFGVGFRVYPQSFIYNKPYQVNSAYNKEDPVEFEQMFNDEEVDNDARFKDGSNNIDSDYLVAEY